MTCPDGLFLNNLIVFPHVASRGYTLTIPVLRYAQPAVLNQFKTAWQNFLLQLPDGMRLQIQATRENDLQTALQRYAEVTNQTANRWSRRIREERAQRYLDRLRAGTLIQQRVVIFFAVTLPDLPSWLASPMGLEDRYRKLLERASTTIQQQADNLARQLSSFGGSLSSFNDEQHYRYFTLVLNPSLIKRSDFDPATAFDPERSIHSNCWWSEAMGTSFGFLMDRQYHTLRVATRWPRVTSPETTQSFERLAGANYRFTVNIAALSISDQIKKEERALKRLEGQYAMERKPSLLPPIEKKRRRIQTLAERLLRPFRTEFLVHTWAESPEQMTAQASATEQAMQAAGFQYFAPVLPTTHRRLFGQMWPGFPYGGYDHYQLYSESSFVPDLLALQPSFTGFLDQAEALFESPDGSPVGIRTITGGAPQHFLTIGGSGSGKSMFLQDFITQIWPHLGLLFLVDYGGSYEVIVRALSPGCQPLVIRPNATFVINYLDTQGLPLTNELLGECAAMVSMMAGKVDERTDRLRRAAATNAVRRLFATRFDQMERDNPERAMEAARFALAWEDFRKARNEDSSIDMLESFVDFRDWRAAHAEEALDRQEKIPEDRLVRSLKERDSRERIIQIACASLAPSEQPTHSELQDWLKLSASGQDGSVAAELAELLKEWCRGGSCGSFLDGESTVSFGGDLICWELSQIGSDVPALQSIARHLVLTQSVRQICGRSRAVRKLALFEEAAAFLDLEGADVLLRRGYEQARKFNAVFGCVIQQYERLRQMSIRAALMGNTEQYFLLKQNDLADVKALAEDLGLPLSMQHAIQSFPKPAEAGHAALALFARHSPQPVCGVLHHYPSAEMHYASCSSPNHVAERRQALRGGGDLVDKIKGAIR